MEDGEVRSRPFSSADSRAVSGSRNRSEGSGPGLDQESDRVVITLKSFQQLLLKKPVFNWSLVWSSSVMNTELTWFL